MGLVLMGERMCLRVQVFKCLGERVNTYSLEHLITFKVDTAVFLVRLIPFQA